jgi:hypothetical protein
MDGLGFTATTDIVVGIRLSTIGKFVKAKD